LTDYTTPFADKGCRGIFAVESFFRQTTNLILLTSKKYLAETNCLA
jgi:hypothetical protein